ncbi:type I restriction modification DNA specificity protein [Larkinella arboricola]|uniref:Type I restriction modification DNA specificity protein n=2 Tax=Larkinella arboricola TaxID=643671 RepID=A0A327WGR9_LARAB|nr:type I restriction modification DNA specificity protein [Larkinella arboricola]
MEADIVREFLSRQDDTVIQLYEELKKLKALLDTGHTYPTASIKELCSYEKGKLGTQATEEGHFPFVVTAAERKTAPDYQFDTKAVCIPLISSTGHGSATLKRIHYQEGKFALANLLFAAIPNDPETELYPKYLYYILDARREELFCPLMKGTANVAMRMEDAVNVRFPLPPYKKQLEIVKKIQEQKMIIGICESAKEWFEIQVLEKEIRVLFNGKYDPLIVKQQAELEINTILSEVWGITSEIVPTPTEA